MNFGVLFIAGKDINIFRGIILGIPVNVMYPFLRSQKATYLFFCYQNVLIDIATRISLVSTRMAGG